MKTIKFILSIAIISVISACGSQDAIEAKKAKLEKLKSQYASLASEIETLETELKNTGANTTENKKVTNVSTTKIITQRFEHYIDVQGTVDGEESAMISAKVPGVVTKVIANEGDFVKAGQVLAELDAEAIRKQVDALEINAKLAVEVYEKQKSLWEKQIGSEIQFKQSKANMETLKEQLSSLKEQVKMYKITSAVNGTVDMVNIKVGQMAAPGVPAFSIVNANKLSVKANVAEVHANKIKEGNTVYITLPDLNKTIKGSIKHGGKGINLINRTVGVIIDMPASADLLPNMVAELKIIDYTNENAVVIPINAIQYAENQKFVFVAATENGKKIARKKIVEVGSTYSDKAEIINGINKDDLLITVGYADLNDGDFISFN